MALDVNVNIKLTKPIGSRGTWYPLLCIVDGTVSADIYAEYSSLSEYVTTNAQKADNYTVTSTSPDDWSTNYKDYYTRSGAGTTADPYVFSHVIGDSAPEWAASTYYAGNALAMDKSLQQAIELMMLQDNAPSKFSVLVIKNFATASVTPYLLKGWRQMVFVDASAANMATMATFIETTDKMLFLTVGTTTALSTLYGTISAYDRTVVLYHKDTTNYPNAVAALVGATAGHEAGTLTYKNFKIKGVTALVIPNDITEASLETDVHGKGALTILEKAGDIVTSEGKVASGEYIDIIDSSDFIVQGIENGVQKVFNNNDKVPYTNAGIAMLEAATLEVLVNAYNNGMISTNDDGTPDYSVNFALRHETTETERAERRYPYGTFSAGLAGAIHNATIDGTISV